LTPEPAELTTSTQEQSVQPVMIQKLAGAVPQALAMLAGMELEIFSILDEAALTTEEIAQAIAARPERVQPLLAVLVSAGLLCADSGRFANSREAAQFLVRGKTAFMGGVYELWADMWHAELQTASSVRTGIPQARHDFGSMSPEALYAFVRGSHSGALSAARQLLAVQDLTGCTTLLDVGGGSGGLSIGLTGALPDLQATVIELPVVAPITQRFVDEANAGARLTVISADVVNEALAGQADVAVCNRFIQVLAAANAKQAIQHIYDALKAGGWLHIIGHILDDSGLTPPPAVAYGLLALNLYEGGQAFTERQHRDWLVSAGFASMERRMLPNGYSLLSAQKRS
jgi:hypothetical protein